MRKINLLFLLCIGCAPVTTDLEWRQLKAKNKNILWVQQEDDQKKIDAVIQEALAKPLDLETSIKIASLNNAELQSAFEDIGIKKADYVQAGYLTNPTLSTFLKFPLIDTGAAFGFDGAFSIQDLLNRRLKKKAAQLILDKTLLEVSQKMLCVQKEAKQAHLELFYAQKIHQERVQFERQCCKLYRANKQQHDMAVAWQDAKITTHQAHTEVLLAQENLKKILGVQDKKISIQLVSFLRMRESILDPRFRQDDNIKDLFAKALEKRIDIKIAMAHLKELELDGLSGAGLTIGPSYEKANDNSKMLGGTLSFAVPCFDNGDASDAQGEFTLRKAYKDLTVLKQNIYQEIAQHTNQIQHLRMKVQTLGQHILPLQKQNMKRLRQASPAERLQIHKDYLQHNVDYLNTWLELHRACIALEYTLGESSHAIAPITHR